MSAEKIVKRKKIGTVVSDKMDKSVVVKVEWMKDHPLYIKKYKISKKLIAHDEKNEYKIGDILEIEEHKPYSKFKSWKVAKKIR